MLVALGLILKRKQHVYVRETMFYSLWLGWPSLSNVAQGFTSMTQDNCIHSIIPIQAKLYMPCHYIFMVILSFNSWIDEL